MFYVFLLLVLKCLQNMNRVLRRQVSLKTGQKLMRLLMDNSTMLLKFTSKGVLLSLRDHLHDNFEVAKTIDHQHFNLFLV